MKQFISLCTALLLMACTSAPLTKNPEAFDTAVYRTQGYYNAAVALENAYGKLPACGNPTSPPLCSDLAVKKKIRKIDDMAYAAIKEAQVAVRSPGFADDKVVTFVASAKALTGAFSDIVKTLPQKGQ